MRKAGNKLSRSQKAGLAPGTLLQRGDAQSGSSTIRVTSYAPGVFEEGIEEPGSAAAFEGRGGCVVWTDLAGTQDPETLRLVGERLNIHPLVLEDIQSNDQRPKAEDYGEYLFVALKTLSLDRGEIVTEQVSLIAGENYLISFQECPGDLFAPVRERLQNEKGRLRGLRSDALLHALLDVIVDNYFLVLEEITDRMEAVEDELISSPGPGTIQEIFALKRALLYLHKAIWPLREVIGSLQRRDSQILSESCVLYLRDLYDHTVQVVDTLETLRDMVTGMLDLYLSSVSNRLNEVMKVLTIIATIFMPLSFIVGLYGMNFKNMPELEWRYGYPAVLSFMAIISVAMVGYFRKRRWL